MAIFVLVHGAWGGPVAGMLGTDWLVPPAPREYDDLDEAAPERGGPFWAAADRVRRSPAWSYREIATNHMIPSNRPEELAGLLLEVAGG